MKKINGLGNANNLRNALFFVLFIVFFFPDSVIGEVYYVDATRGSDSNSGLSTENAWKTLKKVSNASFRPGDSILFKRGETWNERLTISSSGNEAKPVTYSAYGTGEKPRFIRLEMVSGWTHEGGGVYSASGQGVYGIFEDRTKIIRATTPACTNGQWHDSGTKIYYKPTSGNPSNHTLERVASHATIRSLGKSHVHFIDLKVQYGYNGFHFEGSSPGSGGSHVHVLDCEIHDIYRNAVEMRNTGGYFKVKRNDMRRICAGPYLTEFPYGFNVIAENVIVDCNYDEHTHHDGHAIGLQNSSNNVIRDNYMAMSWNPLSIWVSPGHVAANNIIKGNIIVDSKKEYSKWYYGVGINIMSEDPNGIQNNRVYKNIIANNNFGIKPNPNGLPANKFFNNTIVDNAYYSIYLKNGGDHIFLNNLVIDGSKFNVFSDRDSKQTNQFDFNIYNSSTRSKWLYNGGQIETFEEWKNKTGQDENSKFADPKFLDPKTHNFNLRPDSPAIDAGRWLTKVTSQNGIFSSFTVSDSSWFFDGFGIEGEVGDEIKTQSGNVTRIVKIEYSNNKITVNPPIHIVTGEGISLYYNGKAPDIGALEYSSNVGIKLHKPQGVKIELISSDK